MPKIDSDATVPDANVALESYVMEGVMADWRVRASAIHGDKWFEPNMPGGTFSGPDAALLTILDEVFAISVQVDVLISRNREDPSWITRVHQYRELAPGLLEKRLRTAGTLSARTQRGTWTKALIISQFLQSGRQATSSAVHELLLSLLNDLIDRGPG